MTANAATSRARPIVRTAGMLNSHEVVARITGDPRYAAGKNAKPPRKVGSMLVLLDCLSCDKCVPVCPNDANFAIDTPLEESAYEDLSIDPSGAVARAPGGVFTVGKPSQWANYADACNECGNCDVFCPEDGGPYIVKARFFGTLHSLNESPELDGMFLETVGEILRVHARLGRQRSTMGGCARSTTSVRGSCSRCAPATGRPGRRIGSRARCSSPCARWCAARSIASA